MKVEVRNIQVGIEMVEKWIRGWATLDATSVLGPILLKPTQLKLQLINHKHERVAG